MKIWVVITYGCDDCGGPFVVGVYNSEEKAMTAASDKSLAYGHAKYAYDYEVQ